MSQGSYEPPLRLLQLAAVLGGSLRKMKMLKHLVVARDAELFEMEPVSPFLLCVEVPPDLRIVLRAPSSAPSFVATSWAARSLGSPMQATRRSHRSPPRSHCCARAPGCGSAPPR